MKKIKATKLTLRAETIKLLTEPALREAAGGISTQGCITTTCQYTVGVTCNSVNPCTYGPTQTICITYVQRTCAA